MISYAGPLTYSQPLLIRASLLCGYVGVTHEYLLCVSSIDVYALMMESRTLSSAQLEIVTGSVRRYCVHFYDAISVLHHHSGSSKPVKFERDIALLREELQEHPNNSRSVFFLARSLEDGGRSTEAFAIYQQRIGMGGSWSDEVWYSKYRLGLCLLANGTHVDQAAPYLLDAYDSDPRRREPLFHLVQHYRLHGKYHLCVLFASVAHGIQFPPAGSLFVETAVYEWAVADELSVCLSYTSEKQRAADILERVLSATHSTLDDNTRQRLVGNLDWFRT
jgi:hypothetical protein